MNEPSNDRPNCDTGEIELLLLSNCDPKVANQLHDHLETCQTCRDYLESQAAQESLWDEARALLPDDDLDGEDFLSSVVGPKWQADSFNPSGSDAASTNSMVAAVVNSLTPSEYPARLGRLGNYEITGVIGSGGMSVVLKAIDPTLDRLVAIKVMSPLLAGSAAARKRFAREAKAAAAVIDPNVISIHGVSNDDEQLPYLVMEYIAGGSLQKRLKQQGALSPLEVVRVGSQIAAGLAAAHEQGLVHRDIKPANILLEKNVDRVSITDFGLARAVDDASLTHDGTVAGTPEYMSPEQTRGESVDQQSDLFCLGSLLYTAATGRAPFRADSSLAVMRKICDDTPLPIREHNPEIPEWLCRIIEKLMSKPSADRFGSARDVASMLRSCLAHSQHPTKIDLPPSVIELVSASKPSPFWGLRSTAILACTIILALVIGAWNSWPSVNETGDAAAHPTEVAKVVALWKEQSFGSPEDLQFQDRIRSLHESELKAPGTDSYFKTKQRWAIVLLPILLAGIEQEKASFLVEFTKPFEEIHDADIDAKLGKHAEPVGWDWQAVHMLSLGRRGLLGNAYEESDKLVLKIKTNIEKHGNDWKVNFLGKDRTLDEILRECRLHRALVQAINGPPSEVDPIDFTTEESRDN